MITSNDFSVHLCVCLCVSVCPRVFTLLRCFVRLGLCLSLRLVSEIFKKFSEALAGCVGSNRPHNAPTNSFTPSHLHLSA